MISHLLSWLEHSPPFVLAEEPQNFSRGGGVTCGVCRVGKGRREGGWGGVLECRNVRELPLP